MNDQEQQLETILRNRGLAWAIDMFAPSDRAASHYLEVLTSLEVFMQERGLGASSLSPKSLEHLAAVSPYKADAFLQALVSIRSPSILCAAWRIIQGMRIERIDVRYEYRSEFTMQVVLNSPYGQEEVYESQDINDAVFVRHLGKSTVSGKPMFDGFYALRQQ